MIARLIKTAVLSMLLALAKVTAFQAHVPYIQQQQRVELNHQLHTTTRQYFHAFSYSRRSTAVIYSTRCKINPSSPVLFQSTAALTTASAIVSHATTSSSASSSLAWVYMALLAVQFGCQPQLTRAYTPKTIIRSTVVAAQEVVKLMSCMAALLITDTWTISTQGWTFGSWWLGAGIPAALYVVQNYCALMAYQHLPPVTFNVLNQTKTLSAALFCFFILGKRQSVWQIVALILLLMSGLIIERVLPIPHVNDWFGSWKQPSDITKTTTSTIQSDHDEDDDDKSWNSTTTSSSSSTTTQLSQTDKLQDSDSTAAARIHNNTHLTRGVIPVLMASLISGLAGALSQRSLQVWDRNSYLFSMELSLASLLLLGVSSILLCIRTLFYQSTRDDVAVVVVDGIPDNTTASSSWIYRVRQGWTWKTWIPITTNALGGVLVGLVTKYSGSVRKGFALIFGLLLSGILQNILSSQSHDELEKDDDSTTAAAGGGGAVSKEQVVGGCLAAISLWMHSNFPHVPTSTV